MEKNLSTHGSTKQHRTLLILRMHIHKSTVRVPIPGELDLCCESVETASLLAGIRGHHHQEHNDMKVQIVTRAFLRSFEAYDSIAACCHLLRHLQ